MRDMDFPLHIAVGRRMSESAESGLQIRSMKQKQAKETAIEILFLIFGVVSVGFVLLISIYLIISGIPAIHEIGLGNFLFGKVWASGQGIYGILPFILTSIYGTAGAIVLGVPLGLMTAIYLSKAAPKKVANVIHSAISLLAGIPSVVYGLVGMTLVVPAIQSAFHLSSGACLLAAILVLTVMILPYIINVSETALNAVPTEYEEASLALGATETETWFRVSVKSAQSGILASIIQGTGRAIGEAMAIIMVSGNVANMPKLLGSVRFLTTAIVSEMSYASYGSLQRNALFSIGLVLFLFIMLINCLLRVVGRKGAGA
jgi:phosphate transport system permease protein